MRRVPWSVIVALLIGTGIGLAYAWVISPTSPRRITDAEPSVLRADFKDQYRSVVAAAYAATGNLPRAQARLAVLRDLNPVDSLNAQAQRMLAAPQAFERAEQIAALAMALEEGRNGAPASTSTPVVVSAGNTFTPSALAPITEESVFETETPSILETQPASLETLPAVTEIALRPTRTSTPEPGEPFTLTGQETVCDTNLPEGLLQVVVLNRSRRQLAGIEILITWDGGKEQFFTGLKPELGNGYADYLMTPEITYTVQLAGGSDVATGISAPICQSPNGENFLGSIKLTFQQP